MSEPSNVYASAVLVGERGVLIRGAAGSGKSSLALALIAADPAATRLVADDRAVLEAAGGRLLASVPEAMTIAPRRLRLSGACSWCRIIVQ